MREIFPEPIQHWDHSRANQSLTSKMFILYSTPQYCQNRSSPHIYFENHQLLEMPFRNALLSTSFEIVDTYLNGARERNVSKWLTEHFDEFHRQRESDGDFQPLTLDMIPMNYLDSKRCCEVVNINENCSICIRSEFELVYIYFSRELFCIIWLRHMLFSWVILKTRLHYHAQCRVH